jgi:hypothetical protein
VAFILYPSFGALLPLIGSLPFWAATLLPLLGVVVLYALPGAKPTIRETMFVFGVCILFFINPRMGIGADEFRKIAGRELNQNDVVILGFDSVSYPVIEQVLTGFQPKMGRQIIFENASTPMASTSAAWRSIFSGCYPKSFNLPGEVWGHERQSWLPDDLHARGYTVLMVQDDPSTNVYARDEFIDVPSAQGWKWMAQTLMWRTLFPLSEVGGTWWLKTLGGPVQSSSRYSSNPEYFEQSLLWQIAYNAQSGPVFLGSHCCFVHSPTHLTAAEIVRLKGWWKRSPKEFDGGVSYLRDIDSGGFQEIAEARLESLRRLVRGTLDRMEQAGILGRASLFVLSDHGLRESWIPRQRVHHIMLAAFLPGDMGRTVIKEPVSLVDLAPTIRAVTGLPKRAADGEAIPLNQSSFSRLRETKQVTPLSIGMGSQALFNPKSLNFLRNVTFRSDGTYVLNDTLKREVKALIEREDRLIEGNKSLRGGGGPTADGG